MKARYFIYLSFSGTAYHGWQSQPHSATVQRILENALSTILGEKVAATGAGRTDTGVHARVFCAHFDSRHNDLHTRKNIIYRLNRFLPGDISVKRLVKVDPAAHARFSALSRTYRYYVTKIKDPFLIDSAWHVYGQIDQDAMNEACRVLLKYDDFTSFSKLHSDNRTNICRIYTAEWVDDGTRLVFTIKADRFLRNMVRAITGTMMDVGMGKLTVRQFEEILLAKDRCRAGKSAPAKGLFLEEIEYAEEIFQEE